MVAAISLTNIISVEPVLPEPLHRDLCCSGVGKSCLTGGSTVQSHAISAGSGDHSRPQAVVTTVQDVFLRQFRKTILRAVNESDFSLGIGGRSGSFLRIVTEMDGCTDSNIPPPFLLGKDVIVESCRMSAGPCWERDILDLANGVFQCQNNTTKDIIKRDFGTDAAIRAAQVGIIHRMNQIQILVHSNANGYKSHSNDSPLLNWKPGNLPDRYELDQSGYCLPSVQDMNVCTFVFALSYDDKNAIFHGSVWDEDCIRG